MKTHHVHKLHHLAPWLRKTGKILFLGKSNYVFYLFFVLIISVLSFLYLYNLVAFTLYAKVFEVTNTSTLPLSLLSHTFTCSVTFNYFLCTADIVLLIGLAIAVELFVLLKIFHERKKIHMIGLVVYFFSMQSIAGVSLIVLFFGPHATIFALSIKANTEIQNTITKLNNPTILRKAEVVTSTDTIASAIKSSSLHNFSIAELNPVKGAVLSYLKIPKDGKSTLYNASLLPYQLDSKQNKNKKLTSHILLFPNNTLVVTVADRAAIEKLLPLLADRMVQVEFKKDPKSPTISFLNDKDYNVEQKKQEEALLQKQRDYISYVEGFITESDDIIQKNQAIINSYTTDKQNAQTEYDNYSRDFAHWYSDCTAQLGNDPLCEQGRSKIDENLNILRSNIQVVEDDRKQASENIASQAQYKQSAIVDLATAKQSYQEALDNPVTPELQNGVFDPPKLIFVKYYDKEKKTLSFYLDTTLHEYLHFYSSSNTKNLDTFLEEGITDYLKVKILSNYVEPESLSLGYPDEVEVIAALVKKLPKDLLLRFYFDKDQTELEKWFTSTYSASDYKSFILDGKAITYTSFDDAKRRQKYVGDMIAMLGKKKNFSSVPAN